MDAKAVAMVTLPARSGLLSLLVLSLLSTALEAVAQSPVVTDLGETMRIGPATVTGGGASWSIRAPVEDDNGDGSLPSSFRRWWHFQVGNLNPSVATTLSVRLDNAGYSDRILPVWSLSSDFGATFGDWERCAPSALPSVVGSSHLFSVTVPVGTTAVRLAKWFPYPVSRRDQLLAGIASHPHVRPLRTLGYTVQNRPVQLVEITNSSVPDMQKHRVWIHAAIHAAESPAAFMAEGLIEFLLSGQPASEWLLEHLIVDIVPLANPDGTTIGNYRTNSLSVECESQWAAPYDSPQLEVVALRTEIERLMGTPAAPAAQPIEVLLNLHASHNVAYPFHFLHVANPTFDLVTDRVGVVPSVHQLEVSWIGAMRAESPYVARGTDQSSTMSAPARPYVESMMHDRWSIDPTWLAAGKARVMAITLEGTYGRGPDGVQWGTDADYIDVGAGIGRALGRYFGLLPRNATIPYGAACNGALLSGGFSPALDQLTLTTTGLQPNAVVLSVFGTSAVALPLPPPDLCTLLAEPVVLLPGSAGPIGIHQLQVPIPAGLGGLDLTAQGLGVDLAAQPARWRASNGLRAVLLP